MNNAEAKFILQGFRSNGSDVSDATFCAALEHAKHDPGLCEWFERELLFDRAMSAKLSEVQPPAGLRDAILAGGRVTAPAPSARRWWLRPAVMTMAASFALLFAVGLALWPKSALASPTLTDFVIADSKHDEAHGGGGPQASAFQAKLAFPATRLGGEVTVDFEALRTNGCHRVTYQGRDVLEVCFNRNGEWFHCYVVKAVDFPALVAAATLRITDRNQVSLVSWVEGGNVFLVVSKAGREALQQLL